MLSVEQNIRVTRTGPGSEAGNLMRRYWQPVALEDELEGERPVVAVRVLGEDLVLFRAPDGRLGLLDRHCPHRGADLCFGRLEEAGLRCVFHGWLFDSAGRCLEQPAEPPESRLHEHVAARAYPCIARNGIVFGFLGDGPAPALPDIDCFAAPRSHSFAFKGLLECNWLQALEVGIDPAHASFLHRFAEDEDPDSGYGRQFRAATARTDMPLTRLLREHPCPRIETEPTPYGLRIFALRDLDDSHMHVRVTNQVFPHAIVIPMSDEMNITQWHVPVDDVHCYWYAIFTSFGEPVDATRMRQQRLELYALPDYRPRINRHNQYGYDPHEQRTRTYTGMGDDINVHDQWAVESMGPVQDRTREHLGRSDAAIRAYRRQLLQALDAMAAGTPTPMEGAALHAVAGDPPAAIDAIGATRDWQAFWRDADARRRAAATWSPPAQPAAALTGGDGT